MDRWPRLCRKVGYLSSCFWYRHRGHSLLTARTFKVRAKFVPVRIFTRHGVSRSRLPSHLARAPINDMYGLISLTREALHSVGNNIFEQRNCYHGRARALVPTEPGGHSLRVIVQGWAANKTRRKPQGTAFMWRACTKALGSSRWRRVVKQNAGGNQSDVFLEKTKNFSCMPADEQFVNVFFFV